MVVPLLAAAPRNYDTTAQFGTRFLMTLKEPAELQSIGLRLRAIEAAMRSRGIAWRHLPIRNLSVPDAAFEGRWQGVGTELHKCLGASGCVVLHYYAGLGRMGIIASCLLIEFGMTPAMAMAEVRKTHPVSLEAWEQEDYVLAAPWIGKD